MDEAAAPGAVSPPRRGCRIGYSTAGSSLDAPGDRRRFCHYAARRGLEFERADPSRRYDLVVVNYVGDLTVWSQLPRPARLVLDLVDSHLAVPRADPRAALRGVVKFAFRRTRHLHLDYRRVVEATCRRADAVICTTEEQRRDILALCPNVHVILDFQPEASMRLKTDYARGDVFNLVWEGLPWNTVTLRTALDALRELKRRHRIALHLITDPRRPLLFGDSLRVPTQWTVPDLFGLGDVHLHPWRRESFAEDAVRHDLAIIPIPLDRPFFAGKPENKLVLFWRMGMPVIASATPAYERAMRGAGLAMTCRTTADWVSLLEHYMSDEEARREAGARGRAYAESVYSEAQLLGRWDAVLASLTAPAAAGPGDRS